MLLISEMSTFTKLSLFYLPVELASAVRKIKVFLSTSANILKY